MFNSSLPTNYFVEKQVPGFVRENHDKFVKFLTRYYEYLDQDENINDYIRNVLSYIDPDTTIDYFIDNFFDELKNLPKSIVVDKRLLAKHIYDLYDAKGTPKAIELLFRILFDQDISIQYPSENILRASDGIWKQENFFTVSAIVGTLNVGSNTEKVLLTISNKYGTFIVEPTKIQLDNNNIFRVFFDANTKLLLEENQYVIQYDVYGNKVFSGLLKKSPAKLTILSGGKFWQRGTIIKIPGTVSDTIARVTNTTDEGKLVSIEVLEYGYGHSENQTITISPFSSKPSESFIDITYSNNTYTVNLTEYVDYSMNVSGLTSGLTEDAYFMESYTDEIYSASEIISTDLSTGTTAIANNNELSAQDWLDSRTVIVFEFSDIGKPKGQWNSDRGKISHSFIRLQDNYYYQMYSYAIKTTRCINGWKRALDLIHPSGLKYFGEFNREYVCDVGIEFDSSQTISIT